jgi:hypothetical protein
MKRNKKEEEDFDGHYGSHGTRQLQDLEILYILIFWEKDLSDYVKTAKFCQKSTRNFTI